MKTAIIGAGINGLYLAWKLAQKEQEVYVFERKSKIGKHACSGLFSQKILEFIPETEKLIENRISSVFIYFPKKTLQVKFSNDFLVMSHFKLDNLVADFASKAGAKIFLNQNKIEKKEISSEFEKVIGSDGADSSVRKWLNLPKQKFLLGIQGFVQKKDYSNYVETWPTRNGFIWRIPRGEEVEWGIMEKPKKAKLIFDEFLEKKNISLEKIKSSLMPKNFFSYNICENSKIALCGDAAGLIKPWSGGGVAWGLIAAEILLKNFPDFSKYQRELKKFFLPKIIFSKIAVKIIYFLGFNFPWLMPRNFKIKNDFLSRR